MRKSNLIKIIVFGGLFFAFIFLSVKCTGQSNANFKTVGADTIKPREERLGGYNKLFLKKPDNIYVNVETQNQDSSLRNWVGKVAQKSVVIDTGNFLKYSDTTVLIPTKNFVGRNFIPYSDTVVKVLTPWNTNFKNKVKYRDSVFIYVPDQSIFTGSMVIGSNSGMRYISRVSGLEGRTNTGFGLYSFISLTSGYSNTVMGNRSGASLTTGFNNSFFGSSSCIATNTGSNNTGIGASSMNLNTTGSFNTAFGANVLPQNTTGSYNIAVGYRASRSNSTGNSNISIGDSAGFSGTSANKNIYLGHQSGYFNTTDNKLYIENSNSQTPLIGGKFDLDRLGVNKNMTSNWFHTLNVGGTIEGSRFYATDTTGNVDSTLSTKRWVLNRLGSTGFPYNQTLTNDLNWSGNNNINIQGAIINLSDASNNSSLVLDSQANLTVGNSYLEISSNAAALGVNNSGTTQQILVDQNHITAASHKTAQNPLWLTDKFYVDSAFNNYMRLFETSANQDTSTTHSKIYYGRQSPVSGLEDFIVFNAVDGAGQKMQIEYGKNQDVFYGRGWNTGTNSWNPWYILGGKSVDQQSGSGSNRALIVGAQDSVSNTGVRIQRTGRYLIEYDLRANRRDCGYNNSFEIQSGVRRWNNTPQNLISATYSFQAKPSIITGDETIMDTHRTAIVDCTAGDYISIYGHSPTTPGYTGTGQVYIVGAFMVVTQLK